jgi:hypothetical protein
MLSFLFFLLSNRGIQFSGGEIGEVHESLFICATKVLYVHREEEKVRKIVHISNATGVNSDRHSKAPATSTRPIISQARKAELWNYSCEIAAFMCLDRRNAGILQARTHTHTHTHTQAHTFILSCPVPVVSAVCTYISLSLWFFPALRDSSLIPSFPSDGMKMRPAMLYI